MAKNYNSYRFLLWLLLVLGNLPSVHAQIPAFNLPTSIDRPSNHAEDPVIVTTCSFRPVRTIGAEGYHLLISGYFNNDVTKSGTFIMDTGMSYTVIADTTAIRIGIKTQAAIHDGKRQMLGVLPVSSAVLPVFRVLPLNVASQPPLEVNGEVGVLPEKLFLDSVVHLDGIIGADFWSEFGTLFDFPSNKVTVFRPISPTMDRLRQFGFGQAAAIALTLTWDGVPCVSLQLQQGSQRASEKVIVDTGSDVTMISYQTAKRMDLHPNRVNIQRMGVGGPFKINQATLEVMQIGDQTLHHVTVYYPDDDKNVPGLCLGTDILQHYKMLLSISDRKMYLLPAQTPPVVTIGPAPVTPPK